MKILSILSNTWLWNYFLEKSDQRSDPTTHLYREAWHNDYRTDRKRPCLKPEIKDGATDWRDTLRNVRYTTLRSLALHAVTTGYGQRKPWRTPAQHCMWIGVEWQLRTKFSRVSRIVWKGRGGGDRFPRSVTVRAKPRAVVWDNLLASIIIEQTGRTKEMKSMCCQ